MADSSDTLYALYGPDGKLISAGPDERRLWIEEARNQFPGILVETKDPAGAYLDAMVKMMKRGFTMYEYRKVT